MPVTWLMRILINRAIDQHRQLRRRATYSLEKESLEVLHGATPSHGLRVDLERALRSLDARSRRRCANTREGWPPCGALNIKNTPDPSGRGETTRQMWSAYTLDQFTAVLVPAIGEPVINETGLKGRFDIDLEYVRPSGGSAGEVPEGPTLPNALQEQLPWT